MSESATNHEFYRALEILASDLEVLGWDQPHKFYLITGTREDPTFRLLCELPLEGHPADFLQFVYTQGKAIGLGPFPDEAIGLLLVNEGWRHLRLEEAEAVDYTINEVREHLRSEGVSEEKFKEIFNDLQMRTPPSSMPSNLRHEIRAMTAIFRDGDDVGVMIDRGGTTVTSEEKEVEFIGGRIPDAMRRFVAGQEPEPAPEPAKWDAPVLSEILKRGSK